MFGYLGAQGMVLAAALKERVEHTRGLPSPLRLETRKVGWNQRAINPLDYPCLVYALDHSVVSDTSVDS